MGKVALHRWEACLIGAAFACASVVFSSPALANSVSDRSRASTPTICGITSNTSSCLAVVAVANPRATQDEVSTLVQKLWQVNTEKDPSIFGYYELQRCSNSGPSPYQITCVLWSSASRHDASLLRQAVKKSHIFKVISITSLGHSTTKIKADIEIYACLQLSVPPKPGPGAFEAISMPESTLSALSRSRNVVLENVARDYLTGAREQSFDVMRSALAKGVAACRGFGLRTAR
jgi:hypothetical protein